MNLSLNMGTNRVSTKSEILFHLLAFAILTVVFLWSGESYAADNLGRGALSVKEMIEISQIINPSASDALEQRSDDPIFSPNRRRFLLVTQRGDLASNRLIATIWMLETTSVSTYLSGKLSEPPRPKKLLSIGAVSNTPVICGVRWLSNFEIAFLGKRDSSYQQLFVVNVSTNRLNTLSPKNMYVSNYDIRGRNVAYTTLDFPAMPGPASDTVSDVLGQNIHALLFPTRLDADHINETSLLSVPSHLHILHDGKALKRPFLFQGKTLFLFMPMLSLSPDGNYLITLAPVHKIPPAWAKYKPALDIADLQLRPDNSHATASDNLWKAMEPVIVDLKNARVSPLVDAPTGRTLVYIYDAPTAAIWSKDSRRVILSDNFLPLDDKLTDEQRNERSRVPAIFVVDLPTRQVQPIVYVGESPYRQKVDRVVSSIQWNHDDPSEVDLIYSNVGEHPKKERVAYRFASGKWSQISSSDLGDNSSQALSLGISQSLNQPPVLTSGGPDRKVTVWDPNPDLQNLDLGVASIHHWYDSTGHMWSGVLVLPPEYKKGVRYPLVIQTHGYDPNAFFAEGEYTTGSGGRALAAKGIVVLQMEEPPPTTMQTSENGPAALRGFESAVSDLSIAGIIDPGRVGAIGFSFTCYHVLYALTHDPELFAAASITDGNDLSYFQYVLSADTDNTVQELDEHTYGTLPYGKGIFPWIKDAPGFNLNQVKTPLLISAFENTSLLFEWEPYAGLRRLGKPVVLRWLPTQDSPHVLVQPKHRYASESSAVDWYSFWLENEEDPDPNKTQQYERWRKLRSTIAALGGKNQSSYMSPGIQPTLQ